MYNCERCRKDFKRNPKLYIRELGYSRSNSFCRKCGKIMLTRLHNSTATYVTEILHNRICVNLDVEDYGNLVWQDWNNPGCISYYHWHDNEDWRRNHEEIVGGRHV